jgi:hypothetical protein
MPRSDQQKHFKQTSGIRDRLLKSPAAKTAATEVLKELTINQGCISHRRLRSILQLHDNAIRGRGYKPLSTGASIMKPESALALLKKNLPKILKWKPVSDVAQKLDVHRNIVESIVKVHGKPDMILLATDHKMYLSVPGQKLVEQIVKERKPREKLELLTDVADNLGIAPNLAQGFFLNRKIQLGKDLHGRVRLSPDQIQDLTRWRIVTRHWREGRDLELDGVRHVSIARLAKQRADLLEVPGSRAHRIRVLRERYAVQSLHSGRGDLRADKLSQYVPEGVALAAQQRLPLVDAARVSGVSVTTVKHWRNKNPKIRGATELFGKKAGVTLDTFLSFTREKYLNETKLVKKNCVPAAIIALPLQAAALKVGVEYKELINRLCSDYTDETKRALNKKSGMIPRDDFIKLNKLVFGEKYEITTTPSLVDSISFLHDIFKPTCPVVSAPKIRAAVELAALNRGESADRIYRDAVRLFKLGELWSQNFESLSQKGLKAKPMPLFLLTYFSCLADSSRAVLNVNDNPEDKQAKIGDLVTRSTPPNFGIITSIKREVDGNSVFRIRWLVKENKIGRR